MRETRFRVVLLVLLLALFVVAIYASGQKNRQINAPISFDASNPSIVLKMTDHDATGDGLKNSLTDSSQSPDYTTAVYVRLKRENGDIKNLVRFQGELEY